MRHLPRCGVLWGACELSCAQGVTEVDKVDTFRMTPLFTVKMSGEDQPYVDAEPTAGESAWPKVALHQLSFQLPAGTTAEQAQAAAQWLNDNIKALTLTVFR